MYEISLRRVNWEENIVVPGLGQSPLVVAQETSNGAHLED